MLRIKNLHVQVGSKKILQGVDLLIKPGEVHVVMGPNGSGKTTLAMSLMGQPGLEIDASKQHTSFSLDDVSSLSLSPEERAKKGLFVSFQNPVAIAGVSFLAFLRTAAKSVRPDEKVPLSVFKEEVKKALEAVGLDQSFMHRSLNEGFSGGERKRVEIAQLLVLKPRYAILDEIDSGLDVDSLRIVAKTIEGVVRKQKIGILLITHYQRILQYLRPDHVHVLVDGKIVQSGDMKLAQKIEKEGYAAI